MTKTIEQARREAFEAEYLKLDQQASEHLAFIRDDGQYGYHTTRVAWACYNAALDGLCIDLPERIHIDDGECGSSLDISCAHNDAVHACREAIHAAGVRTR